MTRLLLNLKRSLTARLLVLFIGTSALLLIVLVILIVHAFANQWQFKARPHLEQYLDFIRADIGDPPNIEKATELAERLPVDIYIIGPDSTFSTNGKQLDIDEATFSRSRHHNKKLRHFGDSKIDFSGDEDRTLLRSVVGEYQVYYELAHTRNARHRRSLITPALLCVLVILSICFFIIRRMLRPVRDIKYGVKRMGQGDLTYRVPIRHNNDLGELAGSINSMAADIEQMLDAKRQLLLGASHELRSPLTRAKVAIQLLDESKARNLIEDDLVEMEDLIANILESERMKTGHAALQLSLINVTELVQSVVDETQADNVVIECIQKIPLINADETRLRILLRNLIGNAIEYNKLAESAIIVNLEKMNNDVQICVIDSGPGIATEHIEHVTEAFYRPDESRTRSTGGFGLGLHLAKLIAEAHGGQLKIQSRTASSAATNEQSGTSVTVQLPIN